MEITVNDNDVFSMSLDQIIDLQHQRKLSAQSKEDSLVKPPINTRITWPSTSSDNWATCEVVESGNSSMLSKSPQISLQEFDISGRCDSDDPHAERTLQFSASNLSTSNGLVASTNNLSSRLGSPVFRRRQLQSLQQNKAGHSSKLMGPNFFKHYKQRNNYWRDCCSNRCQAQRRLYLLTSQLRAKRQRRFGNQFEYCRGRGRGGLKRSTSCSSINSNLSHISQSSWQCDCEADRFEHRSRSRSRGPSNHFDNSSRNRSRSQSRSSSRWLSTSTWEQDLNICFRKDEILTESIQDEIRTIQEKRSNQSPMSINRCLAEDCKPTVHFTFISMNSRFLQYYK